MTNKAVEAFNKVYLNLPVMCKNADAIDLVGAGDVLVKEIERLEVEMQILDEECRNCSNREIGQAYIKLEAENKRLREVAEAMFGFVCGDPTYMGITYIPTGQKFIDWVKSVLEAR